MGRTRHSHVKCKTKLAESSVSSWAEGIRGGGRQCGLRGEGRLVGKHERILIGLGLGGRRLGGNPEAFSLYLNTLWSDELA